MPPTRIDPNDPTGGKYKSPTNPHAPQHRTPLNRSVPIITPQYITPLESDASNHDSTVNHNRTSNTDTTPKIRMITPHVGNDDVPCEEEIKPRDISNFDDFNGGQ